MAKAKVNPTPTSGEAKTASVATSEVKPGIVKYLLGESTMAQGVSLLIVAFLAGCKSAKVDGIPFKEYKSAFVKSLKRVLGAEMKLDAEDKAVKTKAETIIRRVVADTAIAKLVPAPSKPKVKRTSNIFKMNIAPLVTKEGKPNEKATPTADVLSSVQSVLSAIVKRSKESDDSAEGLVLATLLDVQRSIVILKNAYYVANGMLALVEDVEGDDEPETDTETDTETLAG